MIDPVAKALADHAKADIDALLAKVPTLPEPKRQVSIVGGSVPENAGFATVRITSDTPFKDGDWLRVSTVLLGQADATDFAQVLNHLVVPMIGATEAQFQVAITDDTKDEADEAFGVRIVDTSDDVEIAVVEAQFIIVDNDEPPPPTGTPPNVIDNPAGLIPNIGGQNDVSFFVPVAFVEGNQVKLYFYNTDRYYSDKFNMPVKVRFSVGGNPLPQTTDANPATFVAKDGKKYYGETVIPKPADGIYGLSMNLLGGSQMWRVESSFFTVGVAPSPLPEMWLPATGSSSNSVRRKSNVYDLVKWNTGDARPQIVPVPKALKLPLGVTAAGLDPVAYINVGNWYLEPWCEAKQTLYSTFPDFYRTKDGWVAIRNRSWQNGHNASIATPYEMQKAEYNGGRLANTVSGYSTVRWGMEKAWCVSLRGTLSQIDLHGNKVAVAGRVYKENTVALDSDLPFAQIDAANFEYVGQVTDPDHLKWDAPHDVFPLPSDPDKQALLLDSFKHRIFHVDANFTPAKVTLILSGKGCVDGPIAQARINRPYALVVHADNSFEFCCTPTAADQLDSAIFQVNSDWTQVKKLIGYGDSASGVNRAIRPFWVCDFEPGYILFWEHVTGQIKKLDLATGVATQWGFGHLVPDGWGQIVCDVNGNIGPKYDVFMLTGNSGSGNTTVSRFDKTGAKRPGEYLKPSIGVSPTGSCGHAQEAMGHYQWFMDIHPVYALACIMGFGDIGPNLIRRKLPTDPVRTYDHYTFGNGKGVLLNGTINGFPCNARPNGTCLRTETGHSLFGNVPSWDHIKHLPEAEIVQYLRDGAGGVVPRKEIAGYHAKLAMYAFKYMVDFDGPITVPTKTSSPKPNLIGWSAQRNGDDVTVTATFDKPVFACLCDFYNVKMADDYSTTHTLTLKDCGQNWVVRFSDDNDNQRQTVIQTV
jgi:hypothetical protein